jgi:hypothetical protein
MISLDRMGDICSLGDGMSPCPLGSACLPLFDNPMFDIVSFDNVGSSMIVIFQIMVQQEWSDIMYAAWDSFSFWTWPYFLFLNIVGPMFAIQLFLVVVANRYAEAKSKQNAVDEQAASSAMFEVTRKTFFCPWFWPHRARSLTRSTNQQTNQQTNKQTNKQTKQQTNKPTGTRDSC